ncbi:MAG: hypothetical protein V1875_03140 [Candidatus Altiarchaeota archaeon]
MKTAQRRISKVRFLSSVAFYLWIIGFVIVAYMAYLLSFENKVAEYTLIGTLGVYMVASSIIALTVAAQIVERKPEENAEKTAEESVTHPPAA